MSVLKLTFFNIILLISLCSLASASTSQESGLTGSLVVVNKSDNTVSLIDLESASIVNTLKTGKGPHELAISHDGKWAVSTDFVGGNSLSVFDLVKQDVARTISLKQYPAPHGIAFLNQSGLVAFTSGESQSVVLANIHSGDIIDAIATGQQTTHMLTVDKQNNTLYSTNIRSNSISKIDLSDRTLVHQISTKSHPEAIGISKDGKELWYGANKEGYVVALNTDNYKALATFEGFKFPYRILFSHDQNTVMVPDFMNHNLRFFDRKTKSEVATLDLGKDAGPQGIFLHPNKDIVFLSLNLQHKVVAIDITTYKIIAEFATGNNPDGVVYTPLLFTSKTSAE